MLKKVSTLISILFVLNVLTAPLGQAEPHNHPMQISPELDQAISDALDDLYNLNYEIGIAKLKELQVHENDHPIVAYGVAAAYWWRLSVLVLETDKEESQDFLKAVKHCVRVAKQKIKAGDPTGEAHLAMGGILGLHGRWQVTNRKYAAAYFKGKKAYRYLVKALELNPRLSDANMGKGIFDYYVATLPRIIRALAFIGMGGDKELGLQELHDAADNGYYSETPSKLFLIDIYARLEDNAEKSLSILQSLKDKYPQSPFVNMLEIISYFNHGKIDKLISLSKEMHELVEIGTYRNQFRTQAHFARGAAYMKVKEWNNALNEFSQGIDVGAHKDAFHTWSTLYRGYAHDALGQREQALKDYKSVLKQLRRWKSWENAKRRLRHKFNGTDEEIKKLTL